MKRRLFFAIPAPDSFLPVFNSFKEQAMMPDIRFTKDENLHITVFFLGTIDESLIPEVLQKSQPIFQETPMFILRPTGIIFPHYDTAPQMVWTIFENCEEFRVLVKKLNKVLEEFTKGRHYKHHKSPIPHITLARLKNPDSTPDLVLPKSKLPSIAVKTIHLYESKPTPGGSIYTTIKAFMLR